MRSVLTVLCCLGLSFGDAFCQGKVLIVSRDTSDCFAQDWPQRFKNLPLLESALGRFYKQEVTLHFGLLPDTLEQYDAIFTDLRFFDVSDDSLSIAQELEKLAAYLTSKGKLYIEVGSQTPRSSYPYEYSEFPPFNELVGSVKYMFTAAQVMGISEILGVQGSFTEGMNFQRKSNPTDDHGGLLAIGGKGLTTILQTNRAEIGWQHEEDGRKVVFHWPIVREHYEEFIGRVVCNFFGLCEPLRDVAVADTRAAFSVTYDPVKQMIDLHGAEDFHTIEIYSMLGIRLMTRSIDGESISISHSLPSGNYLVVVRGAGKVEAKPVMIWK